MSDGEPRPIHWYPGHMAKAKKLMEENLKLIDVVVVLLDARAPLATRNEDIEKLAEHKSLVWVLTKTDMADPNMTKQWLALLASEGRDAVAIDARTNAKLMVGRIRAATKEKIERDAARGVRRTVRAMITGIPNVGKSTLINSISGAASAKTGDKPGVTRGKQWIHVDDHLELLDTPGLLWPRQNDREVSLHLAYIAAIRDEILDQNELAESLLAELARDWPQRLCQRYKLPNLPEDGLLETICRKRGCLLPGGLLDMERAAKLVLEDFRSGAMGRISLEKPNVQLP